MMVHFCIVSEVVGASIYDSRFALLSQNSFIDANALLSFFALLFLKIRFLHENNLKEAFMRIRTFLTIWLKSKKLFLGPQKWVFVRFSWERNMMKLNIECTDWNKIGWPDRPLHHGYRFWRLLIDFIFFFIVWCWESAQNDKIFFFSKFFQN